ncbi:MAG TPA: hypothetical protein H9684_00525 [Firmicutes bacterium]|nr:hypothetical protein [Bacillota bacterium]
MKICPQKKSARTLHFEDAVRFNRALDTDRALQEGMAELAMQFSCLTEEEYVDRLLRMLRGAGLELSAREFKTLLLLRRQTDQLLLPHRNPDRG